MADFVNTTTTKTAVSRSCGTDRRSHRFNTLVQDILTNNPWGCTSYQSAGQTLPPVAKTRES